MEYRFHRYQGRFVTDDKKLEFIRKRNGYTLRYGEALDPVERAILSEYGVLTGMTVERMAKTLLLCRTLLAADNMTLSTKLQRLGGWQTHHGQYRLHRGSGYDEHGNITTGWHIVSRLYPMLLTQRVFPTRTAAINAAIVAEANETKRLQRQYELVQMQRERWAQRANTTIYDTTWSNSTSAGYTTTYAPAYTTTAYQYATVATTSPTISSYTYCGG